MLNVLNSKRISKFCKVLYSSLITIVKELQYKLHKLLQTCNCKVANIIMYFRFVIIKFYPNKIYNKLYVFISDNYYLHSNINDNLIYI